MLRMCCSMRSVLSLISLMFSVGLGVGERREESGSRYVLVSDGQLDTSLTSRFQDCLAQNRL